MAEQICTRCVMDSSDPGIEFDENGVCSACKQYMHNRELSGYHPGESEKKLQETVAMMKENSKDSDYDCVLGISGVSSDFRDLDNAAAEGNKRAALAIEVFEYGVRKMIAEYAAAMGGVDAVIFTAGVGENSADMRLHFVDGLQFMGIEIDPEKNNIRGEERIVSPDGAKVKVLVIPTNEELMIAQDTAALVNAAK